MTRLVNSPPRKWPSFPSMPCIAAAREFRWPEFVTVGVSDKRPDLLIDLLPHYYGGFQQHLQQNGAKEWQAIRASSLPYRPNRTSNQSKLQFDMQMTAKLLQKAKSRVCRVSRLVWLTHLAHLHGRQSHRIASHPILCDSWSAKLEQIVAGAGVFKEFPRSEKWKIENRK